MRAGVVAAASCAVCVAAACNALLDNEPGHIAADASSDAPADSVVGVEGGMDAGIDAVVGSETEAEAATEAEAEAATEAEASAEAGADGAVADADADAGAIAPPDFGVTLVLWLTGDVGVTTTSCPAGQCVTRWADQSTWKNDAVVPDGGTSPSASTVAGHGAVSFVDTDGGNRSMSLEIADAPSLEFKAAYSIVAVEADRGKTFPHTGILYDKQDPATPFRGAAFFVDCSYTGVLSATGQACSQIDISQYVLTTELGLFDGVLRAVVTVFDGSSLSIGVNDDAWATQAVTKTQSIAAAGFPAHVGGHLGAKQTMTGDIAELIVLDVAMTRTQYGGLYAYLRAKYALP